VFTLSNAATRARRAGPIGRGVLLASAAGLSLAVSSAQAQQTVNAREGETIANDVVFGSGDDRLIVDISRVDPATGRLNTGVNGGNPAIIEGSLVTGGGNDAIWLNSNTSRTANVVVPATVENREGDNDAVFNRIVYEAEGEDTVLRLENRANPRGVNEEKDFRDGPLRLAGDGTIEVTFGVQASNQPFDTQAGIVVEAGNSAGSNGKLNVIIRDDVTGNDVGRLPGGERRADAALIDARNAGRLEIADGARVRLQDGVAILAGDADVVIQRNATVAVIGTNAAGIDGSRGVGIRSSGRIVNEGRIDARNSASGKAASATAVELQGGRIENRRGNSASGIFGGRYGVFATGDSVIINDSQIESVNGPAIASLGNTVTRNEAGGVISGGMVQGAQVAYSAVQDGTFTDVIVNEGQIIGNVNLGGGDDIFLLKGNGTINGDLDGGGGIHDAYGRSYSESATATLANGTLNSERRRGFEMHGIEASGTNTTVTVTAGEALNEGLQVIGDGTVVNEADIRSGSGYGVYLRDVTNVPGGGTFVNRGSVVSDNFALVGRNVSGTIRNEGGLSGRMGVWLDIGAAAGDEIDFYNSGEISALSQNSSGITAVIGQAGHVARFHNSTTGRIRQTTAGSNDDALFGLNVWSEEGRVELVNEGEISAGSRTDGGVKIQATSIDVDNSGTIEGSGAGGSGLTIVAGERNLAPFAGTDNDPAVIASVRNSGTIRANGGAATIDNGIGPAYGFGAQLFGDNVVAELENDGTIEATGTGSVAVAVYGSNPDGAGRVHFRMTNTGTIRGSGTDTAIPDDLLVRRTAMDVPAGLVDGDRVIASAIQTLGTTDHIVNEGTIIGNVDLADGDDWFENRGTVDGDVRMGEGDDAYVFALGGTLTGTAYGGDGTDTLFIDGSGNQNGRLDAAKYREFERIQGLPGVQQGTGVLSVVGDFDVNTVGLANIAIQIDAGDTVSSQGQVVFTGSDGSERITNYGVISGGVDLGAGDDVVINSGTIRGGVLLGAGNDRYVARAGSAIEGILDGGEGIDTFEFLLAGDIGNLPSGLTGFESYAARGQGTINVTLDQDIDTIELLEGANLILNDGAGTIRNVIGDDSNNEVTITGTLTGGVNLGGGDDILNMTVQGVLSGALDGGAGNDTLNLTMTGSTTLNGMTGFEIANIFGDAQLTLGDLGAGQTVNFDASDNELIIAAGARFDGIVNGGEGRDLLRIQSGAEDSRTVVASQIVNFEDLNSEGPGTLALTGGSYSFQTVGIDGALELGANTSLTSASNIRFGAGDNRLRLASGATVTGGVDGGDGDDLLQLEQGEGTVRSLASVGATSFERLESMGAGELRIDLDSTFDLVSIDGGLTTITAGTTLTAPVVGGAGNDTLAVLGTLVGDVHLGAGDDRLILASLDPANSYSGGQGIDTIELRTASTYENPLEFSGDEVTDFERLAVSGGVVSLTGDTSWDGVSITSGRLIGQAGTTITSASAIEVGAGAIFGSAGTVNADIDVRGTLSPGASPGTMTVDGDVIFRTGSNLLLEVSPTISDRLNISGVMTIETGAAVDITGVLQGTPGQLLDLVVAEGGIQGRFTTVNKSDTVFGFVVQNGNRLQIRSEFENDAAYPTNVRASIDYSNRVLRGGYGVQAYTGALNVLTDAQGRANQLAFAQLTPEAYASATQIGADAGLTLVDGTRQMAATAPVRDGLFLFAQGAFGDAELLGSARTGASGANSGSDGFFGGIGYGFGENTQAGLFVGSLDTTQFLAQLGVRTDADGFAAGAFAGTKVAGLGVHAMLARISSDAETTRTLLAAPTAAVGRYDLDSWVADLSIDYGVSLGGVEVAPRVGLTYVDTKREGVVESGAGAFGLSVDGKRLKSVYGDVAMRVSSTISSGDVAIMPYVEAGYRYAIAGGYSSATGGFTGAPGDGVRVDGARRDRGAALLAAGASIDIAPSVRVNFGYSTDLADADRGTFSGGLSIRF
jgi:fibronectin-binding autotransporter adhesin